MSTNLLENDLLTVSRRAPRRSPKVISTTVASGSESWSIMTMGVGMVSASPWLPSCCPRKELRKQMFQWWQSTSTRKRKFYWLSTCNEWQPCWLILLNTSTSVTGVARGMFVIREDDNLRKSYIHIINRDWTHHCSAVQAGYTHFFKF